MDLKNGQILKIDNRINLLEIDSKTGRVKLNGSDLPRLNAIDIHIGSNDDARIILDMDASIGRIAILIDGTVEWFK